MENEKKEVSIEMFQEKGSEVDLYCLYIDKEGEAGEMSRRNKGGIKTTPFATFEKNESSSKVIFNNINEVKYILICANIREDEGEASFMEQGVKIEITNTKSQKVKLGLEKNVKASWVAMAIINSKEGRISAEGCESYSTEKTFNRDFKEKTGKSPSRFFSMGANVNGVGRYNKDRTPVLFGDGTFMLSAGEIRL